MAAEDANALDLAGIAAELAALAHVQGLLVLDDLWTGYLSNASERLGGTEPDLEGLRHLADRMDAGLVGAGETAAQVRRTLERQEAEGVQEGLEAIRESEPRVANVLDWVLSEDSGGRSVSDTLISACRYVEEQVGDERENLFRKVQKLEAGEIPDPDFRPLFRCAWTLVGVGAVATLAAAGAVATVGLVPAAALGVVGSLWSVSTSWEKSGCSATWKGARDALSS